MHRFRWSWVLVIVAAVSSGTAGTLTRFGTPFGDIAVELYDQDKPATVQNFLRYIQSGRYANEFSHRLIPGFVLQAGGFVVANRGATNWSTPAVATYAPVTNEFKTGKFYSNVFGTIAMAKTSDPNSATSQFFFNLADNSASLDSTNNSGGFTVFGRVIGGTNILAMFNHFQNWNYPWATLPQSTNLVLDQYYAAPFDTLPLLYPSVTDTNLVYLDLSLVGAPTVQIARGVNGACDLTWNSAAAITNYVEFTTHFPPVWQLLLAANGTGALMKTTIGATNDAARFYRVRVGE